MLFESLISCNTYKEQIAIKPTFSTLEQQVAADNPLRILIRSLISWIWKSLASVKAMLKAENRPPYAPALLLKLYLYGYLNKIRSSRKLEQECCRK